MEGDGDMHLSAKNLGKKIGLTGMEMNSVLCEQGFLSGSPGNYYPTAKAEKYIKEYFNQRGSGYGAYGRCCLTRYYDESIMKDLVLTPEIIENARGKCKAYRDLNRANLYARAVPFTPPEIRVDESLHDLVNSNSTGVKFINNKFIGRSIAGLAAVGIGAGVAYYAYKKKTKNVSEEEKHDFKNEPVKRKLRFKKAGKTLKK